MSQEETQTERTGRKESKKFWKRLQKGGEGLPFQGKMMKKKGRHEAPTQGRGDSLKRKGEKGRTVTQASRKLKGKRLETLGFQRNQQEKKQNSISNNEQNEGESLPMNSNYRGIIGSGRNQKHKGPHHIGMRDKENLVFPV